MLKDTNYVVIPAWAINHLDMTPTELIIYSVIYGFSQDGESEFRGSIGYLCDITRVSRQTVISCLKNLVAKQYIRKIEHYENGVSLPRYVDGVSKFYTGGGQEFGHHNTNIDISSSYNNKENPHSECGNANGETTNTKKVSSSDKVDSTPACKGESIEHPTLEQCITYAKAMQMVVDPYKFHSYFDSMGWIDSKGRKVKNWKLKMKTWNSYALSEGTVRKNHQTSSDNEQVAQIAQARKRNEETDNGIF